MIRNLSCILLALLSASATYAFDGDIVTKTTVNGQSMESTFTAKGDKMKISMPQGQGAMIINAGDQTMTIIMDAQKKYMIQPMNNEMVSQTEGDIVDTGETAEIFGRKARKLLFTESNGKKSEIWATDELKNEALNNMPGMNDKMIAQIEEIFGSKSVFPLKMRVLLPSGAEEMSMEVTSIVERDVPDSELGVPEGYQKFEMPAGPPPAPGN